MSLQEGRELACAKINLSLDVLGKREDGYHELAMVMATVDLADTLTFLHEGEGVRVESQVSFLPSDRSNLAAAAALAFQKATGRKVEPLTIRMDKQIPVCAGTAGKLGCGGSFTLSGPGHGDTSSSGGTTGHR